MLQSWRDVVAEDWSSIILGSQGETELTEDDMWKQVIDKSDSTQISPNRPLLKSENGFSIFH